MLKIYKSLPTVQSEKKQFYLITKRLIRKCLIRFNKNELDFNEKTKGKITVVSKKRFNEGREEEILEWKSAESVIKKFNLENKYLFGPVLTSHKPRHHRQIEKIVATDQIIQHETPIPIIEPEFQHENTLEKSAEGNSSHVHNRILTFPLENKLIHSTDKINELNNLRKHLECLSGASFPSVSLILQKTMPEDRVKILERWKQNMIKELGEEGFQLYQKALLENGSSLHNNISSFLSSTPESELEMKEENIGHWKSLKNVLPNIQNVKLLEEFVTHPFLCYKGVVDCFAKYRDTLVVIDWKTSKKPKTSIKDIYDNPLQLAAYVGALNYDPKFQYLARKGLIVVAYESGMPATVHFINDISMKHFWNEWLKRVKKFWEMKILETKNI